MDEQRPFDNKKLFHKLVRLHRCDEQRRESLAAAKAAGAEATGGGAEAGGALRAVESLAADRDAFHLVMREVEEWLKSRGWEKTAGAGGGAEVAGAEPAAQNETAAASETPEELKQLRALLEGSPRLREIFAAEPLFSDADPRAVETLARFADVTPDGQSMLNTQDAVLSGVLDSAQGLDVVLTAGLPGDELDWASFIIFTEHLGKALAVWKADEAAAGRLAALPPEHWPAVLSSLEDGRDYTDGPESEAGKLLRALQPDVPPELQAGFGRPPRLSQIEPDLFKLVWEKRGDLAAALTLLPEASLGAAQAPSLRPAGIEARKTLLEDAGGGASLAGDFEYGLRLRVEMARHLVGVRKDAKVETLIYKWPRAAGLALANRTSIVNVESYLLQQSVVQAAPNFMTEEERELYKLSQEDELFARLLRTKPYFSEIALFQYLSAAPLPPAATKTSPDTSAPRPTAGTGTAPTAEAVTGPTTRTLPTDRPQRGVATPAQTPTDDYETYAFTIEATSPPNADGVIGWQAKISHDRQPVATPAGAGVNPDKLYREVMKSVVGAYTEGSDPEPLLSRTFGRADREYLFRVVQAGRILFRAFYELIADNFISERQASQADGNVRVAVACDRDLAHFPWEWLVLPGEDTNFVLSERHSLVRCLPPPAPPKGPGIYQKQPEPEFVQRLTPPLRVLIVMPGYDATTAPEAEKRAALLEEELSQRGVMARRLTGFVMTPEDLRAAINDLIPHVLHFEGGIGIGSAGGPTEPSLLLPGPLTVSQLKEELKTAGLQLLVLRSSVNYINNALVVQDLLEGLVGEVIPAALAPVRAMEDGPGFEFVRSFYRALCDGKRLEAAVARARLELLSKGGDWSAYALFAHLKTLESSRILPPPAPTS